MAITRTVDYADWQRDNVEEFSISKFQNGIDGTDDSTWDITGITFKGAFKIPNTSTSTDTDSDSWYSTAYMQRGCIDPVNNMVILAKQTANRNAVIARFSIPTLSTDSDISNLPDATLVDGFTRFDDKISYSYTTEEDSLQSQDVGFMLVESGKLYMGRYRAYDSQAGSTPSKDNLVVCSDVTDFENATWQTVDMGEGDKTTAYAFTIPTEHQSDFDGNTHGCGSCCHASIQGRWPYGPAFYGWNPSSITGDTGSADEYMNFPNGSPISGVDDWYVDGVLSHYLSWVTSSNITSMEDYLNQVEGNKMTYEQMQMLPRPDPSVFNTHTGYVMGALGAFIPNNSKSLVFVGRAYGCEFGRTYHGHMLEEDGSSGTDSSSPEPISNKDWHNCIWAVNLDDIKNATNLYDPNYYHFDSFAEEYKEFDESDWVMKGRVLSSTFVPSTNELYVILSYGQDSGVNLVQVYDVPVGTYTGV